MPSWLDQGVLCRLYISTAGDFVKLGTKTDYPFTAGGGGIPAGWTQYLANGGIATDVSWTTSYGRFSVGNASATDVHNLKFYGIYRDFPVTVGKRYLINCQARTTQGRTNCVRYFEWTVPATNTYWNVSQIWSLPDWEDMAWDNTNAQDTTMRVRLSAAPYTADPTRTLDTNWGIQFTNFSITEMEMNYPDPTWHEVTCDVRSLATHYGRDKFTGRFDVATATITINNDDGDYTYRYVHPLGLRPGRFIKVVLYPPNSQTAYSTYYGIVESLTDGYSLDGHVTTTLDCVDVSTLLSNTTVPTYGSEATTYKSGARFNALYRSAGWLGQNASNDPGVFIQQHIISNGRTIRDELGLIADSEGGLFYTDRKGIITYRDRNTVDTKSEWNTVQAELLAQCPDYLDEVKYVYPGVPGNGMTVTYNPVVKLKDIHVYLRLSFTDIVTPNTQRICGQDGIWSLEKYGATKNIAFYTTAYAISTVPLPYNSGEIFWLNVTYQDASRMTTFRIQPDTGSNTVPTSGWTQLGASVTVTNPIAFGPQMPVLMGCGTAGMTLPFYGRIYIMQIRDFAFFDAIVFNIQPSQTPGMAGETVLQLPKPGNTINVSQTGSNVIVQTDPEATPTHLHPVDGEPSVTTPYVVLLRDLSVDWSAARVINDLQLANDGGTSVRYLDAASQQKFGPSTYQRLDFVNDDSHPEYLDTRADDLMTTLADANLRVNSVDFNPTPANYVWAMSVFLNDLVRIRYEHPTQGWGYAVVSHVQGLTQELGLHNWAMSLNVDRPTSFVYWERSPAGTGWDVGLWDVAEWDA
jgi:hypothetical protein